MKRTLVAVITAGVACAALLPAVDSTASTTKGCSAIPAVAHRGGTEKYAENTRNAFRYASSVGAKWWEMDVHFDDSGTPYVIHDDTLDRTTNGHGLVAEQNLSTARAAGLRTKDGQVVPTLYEVLTDAAARGAHAFVELKTVPTQAEMKAFLARFSWTNMGSRVVVTSFSAEALVAVHAAKPELKTGLIENPSYTPVGAITQHGVSAYLKAQDSITAARLDEWSGPLDVYAWTVDTATAWARMHTYTAEPGRLDGAITDDPKAYLAWEHAHGC